ncbi:DUF5810 domain-containing protein [Haloterrigena salinisoli]|uniref:DUF5810 domain-containing protein n=1 Tax=Haloterrigena salinisoli TaxID=3132747 RepID=UPI0030D14088
MGYACPVCDAEQADAEHLANHLAITASLGREEHREWLEEHAPDWGDRSPEELGEVVSQYAPEIETPEFESASHGHDHGRPGGLEEGLARQSRQPGRGGPPGRGGMSSEAESALREARELTQQMRESTSDDETPSNDGTDAGEATDDE